MTSTPITVVGNLTDDPELRFTPGGDAVVVFSVAFNRRFFDRQTNEWKDGETDFHRVTAWRHLAENCAETLKKGMRVVVFGDLRQRHWTDRETNKPRSAWEINASAIGPDLTWATAAVTKSAKGGGIARGETAPDDPWATGSRQRPPAMAGAGAPAAPGAWPAGSRAADEPPF